MGVVDNATDANSAADADGDDGAVPSSWAFPGADGGANCSPDAAGDAGDDTARGDDDAVGAVAAVGGETRAAENPSGSCRRLDCDTRTFQALLNFRLAVRVRSPGKRT